MCRLYLIFETGLFEYEMFWNITFKFKRPSCHFEAYSFNFHFAHFKAFTQAD